jgi:hypothetical protein
MGLPALNLLIRLTERTYTVFDRFDKTEGHPLLLSSGMAVERAVFADLRQDSVSICYRRCFHGCSITGILPLIKNIPTAPLPLSMLPLPARFSQVFLDTFSLQGCPHPVCFASLLHFRPLSMTNQIPETINAVLLSLEGLVLP